MPANLSTSRRVTEIRHEIRAFFILISTRNLGIIIERIQRLTVQLKFERRRNAAI